MWVLLHATMSILNRLGFALLFIIPINYALLKVPAYLNGTDITLHSLHAE